MSRSVDQLELFGGESLNIVHAMKREIRIGLKKCWDRGLSRDNVVEKMNEIIVYEGVGKTISKAVLDSWTKDSDKSRVPSPPYLAILCNVMNYFGPINSMLRPSKALVIGPEDAAILKWAKAELKKSRATKEARLLKEGLNGIREV